jgi:hypothetical protein
MDRHQQGCVVPPQAGLDVTHMTAMRIDEDRA